jgi:hypothetical protein
MALPEPAQKCAGSDIVPGGVMVHTNGRVDTVVRIFNDKKEI